MPLIIYWRMIMADSPNLSVTTLHIEQQCLWCKLYVSSFITQLTHIYGHAWKSPDFNSLAGSLHWHFIIARTLVHHIWRTWIFLLYSTHSAVDKVTNNVGTYQESRWEAVYYGYLRLEALPLDVLPVPFSIDCFHDFQDFYKLFFCRKLSF